MDFSMFENILPNLNLVKDMKETEYDNTPNSTMDNVKTRFPEHTPLAMAYVPFQSWETPYDDTTAFSVGTIFPDLDMPFERGMMK